MNIRILIAFMGGMLLIAGCKKGKEVGVAGPAPDPVYPKIAFISDVLGGVENNKVFTYGEDGLLAKAIDSIGGQRYSGGHKSYTHTYNGTSVLGLVYRSGRVGTYPYLTFGSIDSFGYNGNGRLVCKGVPFFQGGVGRCETLYYYDENGWLKTSESQVYNSATNQYQTEVTKYSWESGDLVQEASPSEVVTLTFDKTKNAQVGDFVMLNNFMDQGRMKSSNKHLVKTIQTHYLKTGAKQKYDMEYSWSGDRITDVEIIDSATNKVTLRHISYVE